MAVAEELQIIIDAKVTGAVKDLKRVQGATDNIGKRAKALTAIFTKLAGPLALGAVIFGAVKFGKVSEKAAADAQEVFSKFDTVFESLKDTANETANEISDSFGIAESTAKELLSATGDLLVGFGFTEEAALDLAKQTAALGSDLASFTNFEGGAERATQALNKALVGESESVKALGIVIRQDTKEYKDLIESIQETNNVSLTQAKALAALQIATEQSGKAIGDYARTSESASNVQKRLGEQTKELQEAIGGALLPTVTKIRSKLGEWAEAIAEVISRNTELRDAERAVAEGINTKAQAILLLENERDVLIENSKLYVGLVNARAEDIAAGKQVSQDAIDSLNEQIHLLQLLKDAEDKSTEAKAKNEEVNKEAIEDLKNLKEAFANTNEGQIEALESSIAYFETFLDGPMAVAVLADLNEQLEGLVEKETELSDLLTGNIINIENFNESALQGSQAFLEVIGEQKEAVEELNETYLKLANDGLGAFASVFKQVGEGSKTLWEGIKQGAKDAMSAILEGLAQEAIVRAALALVPGLTFNPAAAAGYTAAAALAYAASGAVQGFGKGGDFVTNGPQLIAVGETGKERVRIDPQPDGRSGGSGVVINMNGDIVGAGGKDEFINDLIVAIKSEGRLRSA